MTDVLHVAVAVIVNDNNEVCISFRHKNVHQGNRWEFPGGKIENTESIEQALFREIKEELNLEIIDSRPLITIKHDYKDKPVCLHVCKVLSYKGVAEGREGQEVKWVPASKLCEYDFPAANGPIIKSLLLPDKYLITGKFIDHDDFINKLNNALDAGIRLVQLRLKNDSMQDLSKAEILIKHAANLCAQKQAKLMLNLSDAYTACVDLTELSFDGIHADSRKLKSLLQRPNVSLFSASCHNKDELKKAKSLGADFMVLSPVKETTSHPELIGIGWKQFSTLIEDIAVPVYALGGVTEKDLDCAWLNGAQGVSAISAFWK